MSTQIDSLGLYNNPYGLYNPYSTGAMSDDFMAQQTFSNTNQNGGDQTTFQGRQQPQTDTFEKSGSGLSTGLKLGAAAGIGTAAGTYFLGTNPVNGKKFHDDLLNAVDIDVNKVSEQKANELLANKRAEIFKNADVTLPEGINPGNIKEYAETGKAPKELKEVMTQDQAKAIYKELTEIDIEKIKTQAYNETIESTFQGQKDKLSKLQSQRAKIESLADDADLEKFFKENASTFGIEGDEKAIETKAKELARKYKNKAGAVADYTTQIANQETLVKSTRKSLNKKVASYYDKSAKSLKASAPESIQKAFKNFKWKKAGKWGAIAAGAGLLLGWMFGGSNK